MIGRRFDAGRRSESYLYILTDCLQTYIVIF